MTKIIDVCVESAAMGYRLVSSLHIVLISRAWGQMSITITVTDHWQSHLKQSHPDHTLILHNNTYQSLLLHINTIQKTVYRRKIHSHLFYYSIIYCYKVILGSDIQSDIWQWNPASNKNIHSTGRESLHVEVCGFKHFLPSVLYTICIIFVDLYIFYTYRTD